MPASCRIAPAVTTTSASRYPIPWSATIAGRIRAVGEPQHPQRDVGDDLDVDPGVVGHAEPLRADLLEMPPGEDLGIGGGALDEPLEAAVAPGRDPEADSVGVFSLPSIEHSLVLRAALSGIRYSHGHSIEAPPSRTVVACSVQASRISARMSTTSSTWFWIS